MAKNESVGATGSQPTGDKPAESLPAAEAGQLSLHEFCLRLSTTVAKPELIAGFEHAERAASRLSDVHSAFADRFDKFVNSPV